MSAVSLSLILQGVALIDVKESFMTRIGREEFTVHVDRVANAVQGEPDLNPEIPFPGQRFDAAKLRLQSLAVGRDHQSGRDVHEEMSLLKVNSGAIQEGGFPDTWQLTREVLCRSFNRRLNSIAVYPEIYVAKWQIVRSQARC